MTVVIVGDTEAARRVCNALTQAHTPVAHLPAPTEEDLRANLSNNPSAVAVVVRGDVTALRYALLIEHAHPGVRLLVTVFDRTISEQLRRVIPHCEVTSPADLAVPGLVGACLEPGLLAIDASTSPPRAIRAVGEEITTSHWAPAPHRRSALLRGQLRPHDTTSTVLLAGAAGLLLIMVADWLVSLLALHESPVHAIYNAVQVAATVGPNDVSARAPTWYLLLSSVFMLATIALTALLTAGLVNRLLSPRSIAIVGRRTIPTRDHVVVIGLGQVGLRLCIQLRRLAIPVIAVERDPNAANLRLAKSFGVPVLIAHAEDRATLQRLHLRSARAIAAMASEDLDNVEVAIAALVVAPNLRVVLRSGNSDVIAETSSLFHIGEIRDVSAATAYAVARNVLNLPDAVIITHRGQQQCVTNPPNSPPLILTVDHACTHRASSTPTAPAADAQHR